MLHNPQTKITHDNDRIAERRAQVAKLVVTGMRQRAMATVLGVAVGTINDDLKAIREMWKESIMQAAEDARMIDIERTDEIIKNLWTDAVSKKNMGMLDRLLRVLELRARIFGYGEISERDSGQPKPTSISIVEVIRTIQAENDQFSHIAAPRMIDAQVEVKRNGES